MTLNIMLYIHICIYFYKDTPTHIYTYIKEKIPSASSSSSSRARHFLARETSYREDYEIAARGLRRWLSGRPISRINTFQRSYIHIHIPSTIQSHTLYSILILALAPYHLTFTLVQTFGPYTCTQNKYISSKNSFSLESLSPLTSSSPSHSSNECIKKFIT